MATEGLPFDQAIEFFRGKVNIPTERWNDLWQGMHARGFMVAGANRDAILTDFRQAVDKAIAQGTTLEEFRRDFDSIVEKHGWSYNGKRGWRSEVIYSTNVRQAYNAGRWAQLTDPDLLAVNPYLEYRHGDSKTPRPLHLSWNGLVLPADHPWWRTNAPQNGWGCKCKVLSVGPRDLEKMGKSGPDTAPDNGTYAWVDKKTGVEHTIPNGIDPGFDYNIGEAAWGRNQQKRLMEDQGPWKSLDPWGPQAYGRPEKIPVDAPKAKPFQPEKTEAGLREALRRSVGGDEVFITDPAGGQVLVTQAIPDHIMEDPKRRDGREDYFPFIRELIEDPYEIWISFAQSEVSGRVAVRRKYVKLVQIDKTRLLGLYAEVQDGMWVSGDFFRGGVTGAKNLRLGRMLYGRE